MQARSARWNWWHRLTRCFCQRSRASICCTSAHCKLFEPPAGAGRAFVRETHRAMLECQDVAPLFWKRPKSFHGALTNIGWSTDNDVDLSYHVRRSALPRGTGARPAGADLEAARESARPAPPALGNTRDRGPQGRALRDLLEDAPRAGRRGIRSRADAPVAAYRSQRHRFPCGLVAGPRGRRASRTAVAAFNRSVECWDPLRP
jgi:hypothetical protein